MEPNRKDQIVCQELPKYKTYKYRWVVLLLFFLVSLASALQWPTYVIIDNVVEKYYQVPLTTVNWTATVFLLCYVVFVYPATYLVQKWGLRFAVTVAAIGPFVAALVKLLSVEPSRFWIVILSQTLIGITQTYLSFLPASLAAAWFGPTQVSTACGIAISGIQVGTAVGAIVPTTIFNGVSKEEDLEECFYKMHVGVAIFCGATLAFTSLFFKSEPPTPPSHTRSNLKLVQKTKLSQTLMTLVKNFSFFLFLITFSSAVGILFALCFLLNPTIIQFYPDKISDIGSIGLLFLFAGVLGSAVFGIILDKFRRFKETTTLALLCCLISMLLYTFTLTKSILYVYIFQTTTGFFMGAVTSIGFEVGAEITYPGPESVSSSVLLIGAKIFGIAFTVLFSFFFSQGFGIWTLFCMSMVIGFSTVVMLFTPIELRRQTVNNSVQIKELVEKV